MKESVSYNANITIVSLVNVIKYYNHSDFTFMMFQVQDIQEFWFPVETLFSFFSYKMNFIPPSLQMNFKNNKHFLTQVIRALSLVL